MLVRAGNHSHTLASAQAATVLYWAITTKDIAHQNVSSKTGIESTQKMPFHIA